MLEEIRALGPPVHAVHGNVDEPALAAALPAELRVEVGQARMRDAPRRGPAAGRLARLRRRFPDCDAVVFGHSHIPLHEHDSTPPSRSSTRAARPTAAASRVTRWAWPACAAARSASSSWHWTDKRATGRAAAADDADVDDRGGPPRDAFALTFRVGTLKTGVWPTLLVCLNCFIYFALTWDRPHRLPLVVLVASAVGSSTADRAPAHERILRGAWCEPFFLGWSASVIAIIAAATALDGGSGSPLVVLFFLPLVYAALSYPLGSMLLVGALDLGAFVARRRDHRASVQRAGLPVLGGDRERRLDLRLAEPQPRRAPP